MAAGSARLWVGRRRWDMERFGLTPRGVLQRVAPPAAPSVVSFSVPKAGTHLVERILCLHPLLHRRLRRKLMPEDGDDLFPLLAKLRPGEVVCGHPFFESRLAAAIGEAGAKLVFVTRDPRDVLVSLAHYANTYERHYLYPAMQERPELRDRIKFLIVGDESIPRPPIGDMLNRWAGWLDDGAVVVRYEDLVSPVSKADSIADLYENLKIPLSRDAVEAIAAEVVSPVSVTFRSGRSGDWTEVFDADLEAAFGDFGHSAVVRFGYLDR